MSKAIPLLNFQQDHLGFMLVAGISEDYPHHVGRWEGDCVFLMTPRVAHILDDPAYMALVEHRVLDEHKLTVINDGATISFEALSSEGSVLFIAIPLIGLGEWGLQNSAERTICGCAQLSGPISIKRPRNQSATNK